MAERSMLWTTNNVGHGPSSGYASDRWQAFLRKLMQSDLAASGSVMFGIDNQLAVTGTATPLAMNTGAAIVYGFFYENDTSKNLAVTTPVVGTTGGRVVLRADFAAQTVTAVVKLNTDGVAALPALTQTPGTTYEVSLYSFTVTTGGVITLTDTRSFTKASIRVYGSQLDPAIVDNSTIEIAANVLRVKDGGITAAKIAAAVAGNGLSGGAGTALAVNVDASTIEINADTLRVKDAGIITAKIADANVTLAKLAADSVDDTKAGNRVPQFYRRQGGDATNWYTQGTTNYTPTTVRIQAGSAFTSAGGSATITFPVAFSATPLCFATADTGDLIFINIRPLSATQASVTIADENGVSKAHNFTWLAIGAE